MLACMEAVILVCYLQFYVFIVVVVPSRNVSEDVVLVFLYFIVCYLFFLGSFQKMWSLVTLHLRMHLKVYGVKCMAL